MTKIRNQGLIDAFGKRVRSLRIEKGITMETLAATANIEYRQVSDIELGRVNPTLSTVYAIAQALEVDLPVLLTLDDIQL